MPLITVSSFAKINWTLEVLSRLPNGYHELHTVFQTVDLCDELSFEITPSPDIHLSCNWPYLATDETNLIVRAAQALQRFGQVPQGVKIHATKRIPTGAGLGGGSSNAAVTLLALSQLWSVPATSADLQQLAEPLGADVPFFLYGGTALGTGRGDKIEPLPDVAPQLLLLVNPGMHVPTGEIFRKLSPQLTKPKTARILPAYFFPPKSDYLTHLCNDLELTVFETYPTIGLVRQKLLDSGATAARMSGSGATVFGVFADEAQRTQAATLLAQSGWQVWPCKTVNQAEYKESFKF